MNDIRRNRPFRYAEYVWLAYLGFLFVQPLFEPHIAFIWPITLVSIVIFLPVYFTYQRSCNLRLQWAMLAVMVLLGAVVTPINGGGASYFIYAAAMAPFSLRAGWVVSLFAAEIGLMFYESLFVRVGNTHMSPWGAAFNSIIMTLIGTTNIFMAQEHRNDSKLRMKQEEIEALAAVAERERIARDLHDVLGHTLSVIVLKAELAGRLLDAGADPARARAEIADVEHTSRTALAEVREAIGGYRARGLAAEIESARKALAAAGVALHAGAVDVDGVALSPAEETVLSLALREAVTNIVRHAQAHTCTLRLANTGGHRRLIIHDDGASGELREGNGLRGMRERVEALGGRLLLQRDAGTRLQVELPIVAREVIA